MTDTAGMVHTFDATGMLQLWCKTSRCRNRKQEARLHCGPVSKLDIPAVICTETSFSTLMLQTGAVLWQLYCVFVSEGQHTSHFHFVTSPFVQFSARGRSNRPAAAGPLLLILLTGLHTSTMPAMAPEDSADTSWLLVATMRGRDSL